MANKTSDADGANDCNEFDADNIDFGKIEAGQTLKAIVLTVEPSDLKDQ